MSVLDKIIKVDFPDDQYYPIETDKKQIVLHHTVSYRGVQGDINWWLGDDARVATHIIIDWKGVPYQCYSTRYWGHHLGVKVAIFEAFNIDLIWKKRSNGKSYVANNEILNQHSIGVEIDSLGPLELKEDGKLYDAYNREFKDMSRVYEYDKPFRGYKYYEKYTDEQIQTTKELLLFWKEHWNIPLTYNADMWDMSKRALSGEPGVWAHVSFREANKKQDVHPQENLIEMLKGLTDTSFTKVKHV